MSRHTPIKGRLCRSFGPAEDGWDVVVELDDSGKVTVRKEPEGRRIRRGEKLPSVTLDPFEIIARGSEEADTNRVIDKLLERLPIADLSEIPPDRLGYALKTWLLSEADRIRQDLAG